MGLEEILTPGEWRRMKDAQYEHKRAEMLASAHGLTVDGDPATGEHWALCDCGWRSERQYNTDAAIDAHDRHIAGSTGQEPR